MCDSINVYSASGEDIELTNLILDHDDTGYFLSATYRLESESDVRELNIPRIRLPIKSNDLTIKDTRGLSCWNDRYMVADLGFGYLTMGCLKTDDHDVYFTETVIEEKTHEMTLDDIEKKLGYKVKIINKKE